MTWSFSMPRRFKPKPRRHYCDKAQKVIFPTELDVKIELSNHVLYGTESRAYKCPWGKHFHITTQEKRDA
jgi:hypothetical protein